MFKCHDSSNFMWRSLAHGLIKDKKKKKKNSASNANLIKSNKVLNESSIPFDDVKIIHQIAPESSVNYEFLPFHSWRQSFKTCSTKEIKSYIFADLVVFVFVWSYGSIFLSLTSFYKIIGLFLSRNGYIFIKVKPLDPHL